MNPTAVFPGLALLGLIALAPVFAEEAPVSRATDPQQQISQLQAEKATLTQQIDALDEQISAERERPMPEKAAFEEADATLDSAKNALMETPSVANHQRVEKARFAYLMAERKYRRANQQLAKIERQREAADQRLAANAERIRKLELQQQEQQQAKREQEASQLALQQEKAEQQRRQKAKKAQQKRNAELKKARAQHAAAMAEIKRLKEKLAPRADSATGKTGKASGHKKPSRGADKVAKTTRTPSKAAPPKHRNSKGRGKSHKGTEQTARSIATRTPSKKVEPKLDRAQWIRGGRERYWALLKAAGEGTSRRRGSNKLLQVNTYQGDRLLKQTSHSLKPLGNQVYQAKSVVRAGRTEFIIDGKRWAHQVPARNNKDPFVFVLDARRSDEPKLLLFAKSDVD